MEVGHRDSSAFPNVERPSREAQPAEAPASQQGSFSVAVIEDEVEILEGLQALLEQAGYRVIPYRQAELALKDLAAGWRPDLIIFDLMMPGMSGWQFRAEQKLHPGMSDIPVIALSGDTSPYAAAINADAYMRKPVDFENLRLVMEQLLLEGERRRLAAQAIELERLRSLGMLVASVAHEINNPLTYVLGSVELAEKNCREIRLDARRAPELVDRLEEKLEAIADGSQRIASIVQLLTTFVRGGHDGLKPVDPLRPLQAAMRLASHQIEGRARLFYDLAPVPCVKGNEARLAQVFLNVLVNAAQALPPGQRQIQEVRIRSTTEGSKVVIEIADTGPGVPPELSARIFEPFFTTKPPGTGTGLGLSISRDIMEAMGGRIAVKSEPGRGATFRIELPRYEKSVPEATTTVTAPTAGKKPQRILVLDDEPFIGQVVKLALEEHQVDVTVDPGEALRLVADKNYDVIFCDLKMPTLSGMDFHEELTRIRPDLAKRFVLMTGAVSDSNVVKFARQFEVRVLKKPFDVEELVDCLEAPDQPQSLDSERV